MLIAPTTYAAELEQAIAATEVLDQQPSRPGSPWSFDALTAVVARFGHAGEDLPFEYQNDIYEIECGRAPAFVLFH